MAGISSESAQEWLRNDQDVPIVQHMHSMCASQGKTVEDVTEAFVREFLYEGPPGGDWKTYEHTHIGFYELSFADKTSHQQYWNFAAKEPIKWANVKALLDMDRLEFSDRAFLEANLGNLQEQTGAGNEEAEATNESSEESPCSGCREQTY